MNSDIQAPLTFTSTLRHTFQNSRFRHVRRRYEVLQSAGVFKLSNLELRLNIPNVIGWSSKNYVILTNIKLTPVSHKILTRMQSACRGLT
jgi:hypothetical protein